ncbi:hypothetical protein [Methanobacterium sp.]|uniref:hypothetical protein n=1 Tax=Methanobacterium sp. TaxID=2164 RepID=UPI003C75046C
MDNVILKNYNKEYSLLESLQYSNKRSNKDIESSSLISGFHELFFSSFKHQLGDIEKNDRFRDIEDYCTERIKFEYIRTNDLNVNEFYAWHLSIFMTIQSFIKISRSKYSLVQKNQFVNLFDKLLNEDLYKFTELNSSKLGLKNISNKLDKVVQANAWNILITQSNKNLDKNFEITLDKTECHLDKYDNIHIDKVSFKKTLSNEDLNLIRSMLSSDSTEDDEDEI